MQMEPTRTEIMDFLAKVAKGKSGIAAKAQILLERYPPQEGLVCTHVIRRAAHSGGDYKCGHGLGTVQTEKGPRCAMHAYRIPR